MSKGDDKGMLEVLIKVYFDTKERPGGKMTQALDSIPIGHFVDFKGPIGHFEYLSDGNCTINHKPRHIKRFIMICGGSGITPIFQVLRAIMEDENDSTKCLVLDGNRMEEDILCKTEMDALLKGPRAEEKCRLIHTLSKPSHAWAGLKGRVGKELIEKEVGQFGVAVQALGGQKYEAGQELVLICGPETLEKSVHGILNGMGWDDENILFF